MGSYDIHINISVSRNQLLTVFTHKLALNVQIGGFCFLFTKIPTHIARINLNGLFPPKENRSSLSHYLPTQTIHLLYWMCAPVMAYLHQ